MKLNKMVLDNKKIEEDAQGAADLYEQDLPIMSYNGDTEVDGQHHFCQEFGAELFKDGAKWATNEFLKDLWHPASEVPRNDYTDILVVCKEPQRPIVLNLEDILDGTLDDIASYNDMWMHLCDVYRITKYYYIGDLLPKTKKGYNHD